MGNGRPNKIGESNSGWRFRRRGSYFGQELRALCDMTRLFHTLIVLGAVLTVSCGRRAEVYWSDGNFEVYAPDMDSSATRLGYNHHPGTLGLVKEQVLAAGSTAQWVFVERLDRGSGRTEFYII